ncbi:8-oxo-dGTP pyrophosphatase MutT, NUDIX family [Maribacter dokdonensis]|uniref:8-oxo-dGTP pyrophosphatase MutT, NUDIX family n=1 Tax=Maribacter dokdonensis TaxID=320912 RepID=A0A1H4UVE8_9FLAO|nr:NUDIX domain-containing protein [Maribacter dokdonensis]SEC72134.1 8-oxo-dGTP pyrophosphatase MutT, NUDIX family [Maribacter dokdonensis]
MKAKRKNRKLDMKDKSAIIPYRFKDGQLELLLIKNSSNTKWVIPKGTIEESLKPTVSATKEAYEEAGVLGIPIPILVGTYKKNGQEVPTYLLRVLVELKHYEEDSERGRSWHKLDKLNKSIVDDDLLELTQLAAKIVKKNGYYFKYAIRTFCQNINIALEKITKKEAKVIFVREEKGTFEISITRKKSFLYFSLNSDFVFKTIDDIPIKLMRSLLMDNVTSKMGYWGLKDLEIGFAFTRMYNEELHLLNSDSLEIILNLLVEKSISMTKELKAAPPK